MTHSLGSFTSGVDGSSEGGRINTNDLPGALVIYGVALVLQLQAHGYKGRLTIAPVKVDGTWCLELTYQGDAPTGPPDHWHGHRVIVKAAPPPPAPAPAPAPAAAAAPTTPTTATPPAAPSGPVSTSPPHA